MNDHQGRVLLLTGAPGSGKTTIMKKVAAGLSGKRIRGLVTGEIRQAGRRVGFELSMFTGEKRLLAHVDIDSRDRVGRYGVDVATLEGRETFPGSSSGENRRRGGRRPGIPVSTWEGCPQWKVARNGFAERLRLCGQRR